MESLFPRDERDPRTIPLDETRDGRAKGAHARRVIHHRYVGLRARFEPFAPALWWIHSAYALAFGVAVMWLGQHNFEYLRLSFLYVGCIWLSSLLLPRLAPLASLEPQPQSLVRLIVNYLNKNLYQQLLFFVLPLYYASATFGSINLLFVLLLAVAAVISTTDIVYDHHVSKRRGLTAPFFALAVFVSVNLVLPVIWRVPHLTSIRFSAALALFGYITLRYRLTDAWRLKPLLGVAAAASALFVLAEWGRPLIPPAPLKVQAAEFGTGFDADTLQLTGPVNAIEQLAPGQLYALTSVSAPPGLRDRVRHRWYLDEAEVYTSRWYEVIGGRDAGYRLWTSHHVRASAVARLRVDVESESGQLIGRASLGSNQDAKQTAGGT